MDTIIHDPKNESRGRIGHVRMPTIQEDRDVMIPMQENERFLVNDDEKRIEQFWKFGQDKELYP
jgi:hypothetical protein